MRIALALSEDRGLDSPVLPYFKGAPLLALLSFKEGEVEVSIYENRAREDSELAQVLLSYGVNKVVYPQVKPLSESAFKELGIEVVKESFSTLKEAIYSLF